MSGELLASQESASFQFINFVDAHAEVVLESDSIDPDMTRYSSWTIINASKLVPIDTVQFKVAIDIERDKTMYHEIRFSYEDTDIFWIGYDSEAGVFSAAIGEQFTNIDFSYSDVKGLLDELSSKERVGELSRKNS